MTLVSYYVLPMLLGRTWNAARDLPGLDIFPQEAIDNAQRIQRYMTDSQYRMVMDSQEARDFLDVSGELSLKIKAGQVDVQGLGSYLRENTFQSNMVEILVKVNYETETFTLQSTAEPLKGWTTHDPNSLGTHFIRSITYGGEMVASLRFTTKNTADREIIKAAVTGNLQSGAGSFGLGIKGNFSQLLEDLKETASMEIHYFATVPIKGVPSTMEGLMELVDSFAKQTAEINGGLGVPIRMEMFSLSSLDSGFPRYLQTRALTDQIDLLEAQFDDLRGTHRSLLDWMANVPPMLNPELETKIGKFNEKLEAIIRVFNKVIGAMDISDKGTAGQFQPAFDAYSAGTGYIPDKYSREFLRLQNATVEATPELQNPVENGVYTRWGVSECPQQGTELVYEGNAVSTDNIRGGSTQFLCLPVQQQWAEMVGDGDVPVGASRLSPLLYDFHKDDNDDTKGTNLTCAVCRVQKRTAVTVIPGYTSCPPRWTKEYGGRLVSSDARSRKGQFMCLDEVAVTSSPSKVSDVWQQVHVTSAQTTCGTLPCNLIPRGHTVPCVVCTY